MPEKEDSNKNAQTNKLTRYISKHKKEICNKPKANSKLNVEKLKTIPVKSGSRKDCSILQ